VPADHELGESGNVDLVFDAAACHLFDAGGARVEPVDGARGERRSRVPLYLGTGAAAQ